PSAVGVKIALRQLQGPWREQQEASAALEPRPCPASAEPIADIVAQDGRQHCYGDHDADIEDATACKKACEEHRRFTRHQDARVLEHYEAKKHGVPVCQQVALQVFDQVVHSTSPSRRSCL